jgi:hypothetical protein
LGKRGYEEIAEDKENADPDLEAAKNERLKRLRMKKLEL